MVLLPSGYLTPLPHGHGVASHCKVAFKNLVPPATADMVAATISFWLTVVVVKSVIVAECIAVPEEMETPLVEIELPDVGIEVAGRLVRVVVLCVVAA